MHSIPTCIAGWQPEAAGLSGQTFNVYRTAQGRLAVHRGPGDSPLEVYESPDEMADHVPAELVKLVRDRLGRGR